MMLNDEAALHLPEQTIPPPKSLSAQAQAYLAQAAKRLAETSQRQGEPGMVIQTVAPIMEMLRPLAAGFKGSSESFDLPGGGRLCRATPEGRPEGLAQVA